MQSCREAGIFNSAESSQFQPLPWSFPCQVERACAVRSARIQHPHPSHSHLPGTQICAPPVRHHRVRPRGHAHSDPAHRHVRAAFAVGGAGRCVTRPASRHRAERRQALLSAQRCGLERHRKQRLEQHLEPQHTRRFHADHAARRADRRRPGAACERTQRDAKNRPSTHGRADRSALEQGRHLGGLPQLGAVSGRGGGHQRAVAHAVWQTPQRIGRA